jgi:predicted DNA-binding protein with PD1-like motif
MIVSEGRIGRIFVLRLGDGDRIPDAIETFARDRGIGSALVTALGGLENGRLVVGPADGSKPREVYIKNFERE